MKISVRTLTGKVIEFLNEEEAQSDTTIYEIKQLVEKHEGIPPAQQRLVFGGKQMSDDKTLSDYGITTDVQLHLVLALRGGN